MKWRGLLAVLAALLLGGVPAAWPEAANGNFDFSGIDAFWTVVDVLEDDRQPSDEAWAALFETPGYAALLQSEFSESFFRKAFSHVFMPSKQESLAAQLESGRGAHYLRHYLEVGARREELHAQAEWLRATPITETALRRTCQFMEGSEPTELPSVSFVVFANDGRGYDPIVIDLLATVAWDIEPFLAHEFHHWYRNRQRWTAGADLESSDQVFLGVLDQIHAEGLADQIDKAAWLEGEGLPPQGMSGYVAAFKENLLRAPEIIRQLDSLLCVCSRSPEARDSVSAEFAAAVPQSGHPIGYYMARVIRRELGLPVLVRDIGDPVAFFERYSRAARMAGPEVPALSGCMRGVLRDWREHYR